MMTPSEGSQRAVEGLLSRAPVLGRTGGPPPGEDEELLMGKKGDGATSAKLVTTLATAGGVFVLRKVLAAVWTKITGKEPPTDLANPRVTLPEVLIWAVATGVIVEAAKFAIVRGTTRKSVAGAEAEAS
jgi:Protein of unknown function (DUF4235)